MGLLSDAQAMISSYSTTWHEPIATAPPGLHEALTGSYLVMRAVSEIDDHPSLSPGTKAALLRQVSTLLQVKSVSGDFHRAFARRSNVLPDVTLRLAEWSTIAPPDIAPRILETFAVMAERMATWMENDFAVHTERDLDQYTYVTAGTLVLLLSDLWAWHDGTRTDRAAGIAYGRALRSIGILADLGKEAGRGTDFWPDTWSASEMKTYAAREAIGAHQYVASLDGPARVFCHDPLMRAVRLIEDVQGSDAV